MSFSQIEENTLGTPIGKPGKKGIGQAARRLTAGTPRPSIGMGFLTVGAAVVVSLRAVYGISWSATLIPVYPVPGAAIAAWGLLITTIVASVLLVRMLGERLPTWLFATLLAGLTGSFALDLVAIWGLGDVGAYSTAAPTAVMALVLFLTVRPHRQVLGIAIAFGIAFVAAVVLGTRLTTDNAAQQLTTLAFAVLPAFIGSVAVRGFQRMVQLELDRVLVQSTVSAPRFAVGMLASEELARLDLAAEKLLDSIADGSTALPLDPKTASTAASLATELRLHLIEGRRETWLYHAITESEMLGRSVRLIDKNSLAGLLDPVQRDGLLGAVWLLVNEAAQTGGNRTVTLTVGPVTPGGAGAKLGVPIVITTTGASRNRVDPATWDALRRVGRYSDTTENGSLRVDVECLVDNPAD